MKNDIFGIILEGIGRLLYVLPKNPKIAQIEITNKCNFKCTMCQRGNLKVPVKDMDLKLYKNIIDRLTGIKEVYLTGWGEPLMQPKIIEMIAYAKNKGMRVSFTSNGSLLTKDISKKLIKSGIDSISFSVDEIIKDQKTIAHPIVNQLINIKVFAGLLKKVENKPDIIVQSTLHKNKEDKIYEVIKWASVIGANAVNVNRLDLRFTNLKRPNISEEKSFADKLDKWGKQLGIRTEFRPYVAFWGFSRIFFKLLAPYLHRGGRHCLRIYDYVYINMNGGVTPCCALPKWTVGNILTDELKNIWNGEKMKKFRNHDFQRNVCGKCDVLEVKQHI